MQETCRFRVVICGAGIVGLTAAVALARANHQVVVLERRARLDGHGAGMQCQPSVGRILAGLGLADVLKAYVSNPERHVLRRYCDGSTKGFCLIPQPPSCTVSGLLHRADLQRVLYDAALEAGADIRFGQHIVAVDEHRAAVHLKDGSDVSCDLVIAADGVRSAIRNAVIPQGVDSLSPTDLYIWRAVIDRQLVADRPEFDMFFDQTSTQIFMGPGRHCIVYPMHGGDLLNMDFSDHSGSAPADGWLQQADPRELAQRFESFDPRILSLLDYVEDCSRWKVAEVLDLPRWSSISGKVVLMGDAAHSMSPHIAQGAAQGIEDVAVFAELLSKAKSLHDLPQVTQIYEELRRPRVEKIQAASRGQIVAFQLPDGPNQQKRDEGLARVMRTRCRLSAPKLPPVSWLEGVNMDSDAPYDSPEFRKWMLDFDSVAEARHQSFRG